MTRFGYHVSHEQYPPSELLDYARAAENAGFDGFLSSDHFHPWLESNGHSGYAWSWMGAALATTRGSCGVVCAPGDRYHPAVVAQGAATLAEMFPDRFWMAVGSGEAINEHVAGHAWPDKKIRNARLRECADIMRRLWRGDTVTYHGLIDVVDARLYSLPAHPPQLFGAAVSEQTAEWVGSWADGLIVTGREKPGMEKMIAAFRRGGGDGKPIHAQHVLSWARTDAAARQAAYDQWRFSALEDPESLWNLRTPEEFADATAHLTTEAVTAKLPSSASLEFHLERLRAYAELGVDRVFVLNVGKNQREFIEVFGKEVLPAFR